jgi:bifunctional DNase/RNase
LKFQISDYGYVAVLENKEDLRSIAVLIPQAFARLIYQINSSEEFKQKLLKNEVTLKVFEALKIKIDKVVILEPDFKNADFTTLIHLKIGTKEKEIEHHSFIRVLPYILIFSSKIFIKKETFEELYIKIEEDKKKFILPFLPDPEQQENNLEQPENEEDEANLT